MTAFAGSRKAYAGSYEIEFYTGSKVVRNSALPLQDSDQKLCEQ
eukprot:COSAG02_NODE_57616_length_280_cov_0.569061_1_plen_43_part_10